jgi:hypothetical protein
MAICKALGSNCKRYFFNTHYNIKLHSLRKSKQSSTLQGYTVVNVLYFVFSALMQKLWLEVLPLTKVALIKLKYNFWYSMGSI